MKLIILAAGSGTRLRPLTSDRPKCLIAYRGRPLIDHILTTAAGCGIDRLVVVGGYRADALRRHLTGMPVAFYTNPAFDHTNMVHTLFCAEDELHGDVIISYSDIIYCRQVLRRLINCPADIAVVVDYQWERLWRLRMDNPLEDAETMKIDEQGRITELGRPARHLGEIQGQYIGLLKLSAAAVKPVRRFYNALDRSLLYDGGRFEAMYMTTFLQLVVDRLMPVKAVRIDGGWLEFDSLGDLQRYAAHNIDIDVSWSD